MSQNQTFNGVSYPIPTQGDLNWAAPLDRYLIALGTYALAPSGGLFTLTANVNFGASFGLLSAYFSTRASNPASAGLLRLANADLIEWRNAGLSGNNTLGVDSSDNLVYNGVPIPASLSTLANGKTWIGSVSNLPVAQTLTGDVTVTNAGVTSIGADKIVNAQINSAAAIAYSKLNLTGSLVNADIFSSAAIALTKLASLNASIVPVTNGSGFLTSSAVTSTEVGYVSGVTSAIQTQIDSKQATGSYITALTGDLTASGPGSVAGTLATVNSNVGSFTLASITVNAKGLITAASNGSAGAGTVTNVTGTANQIAVATGTSTPVISITSPLTLPGAMTAGGAIAMATNKITGLGAATTNGDAVRYEQLQAKAGLIAQMIQATTTSATTTSSTSYTDTALTGSITPSSATSKIKISAHGTMTPGNANSNMFVTIARGGSALSGAAGFSSSLQNGTTSITVPWGAVYLDSPATTSATTYTVRIKSESGTSITFNGSGQTAVILLEEILQ